MKARCSCRGHVRHAHVAKQRGHAIPVGTSHHNPRKRIPIHPQQAGGWLGVVDLMSQRMVMLECYPSSGEFYRFLLRECPEGVYVLVYKSEYSRFPEMDYLQGDLNAAKSFCEDDLGCGALNWRELRE